MAYASCVDGCGSDFLVGSNQRLEIGNCDFRCGPYYN